MVDGEYFTCDDVCFEVFILHRYMLSDTYKLLH